MDFNEVIFFSSFIVAILSILLFDLGVFTRKGHHVSFKESILWTTIWVLLSMVFYFIIRTHGDLIHGIGNYNDIAVLTDKYQHKIALIQGDYEKSLQIYKSNLALEYLTGYLIEYSLSMDNIFVIIMLFISFNVRNIYYKRVLFWGILGAIIMRFIFIFLSSALIQKFSWILYLFGGLLVFTGVKMFLTRDKEKKIDPQNHGIVKFTSKYFSVYPRFVKQYFFIKKNKKLMLTPLFIILLVIEFTDVVFAVDSVPAVFSATKDPYIVFFSNIFAILGLRSLFFLLMNIFDKFHYLKIGLSVLLTFIGLKMILEHWVEKLNFTTAHSLYIIASILLISIIASLLFPKKDIKPKNIIK